MLGIVVVTYNSEEVIGSCLRSCCEIEPAEIVVVDNASTDGTLSVVREFDRVRIIANPMNRGFAAAVNQGISSLSADVVLLLNPDARIDSSLDALADAFRDPKIGAACGRLVDEKSQRVQDGFNVRAFPTPLTLAFESLGLNRIWPSNPVNQSYRLKMTRSAAMLVDQPAGAFLAVRKSAWKDIGGFDESFHPVWFEDVDFCRRLHLAGFGILYVPVATARHVGAHSAKQVEKGLRQLYWFRSLLKYSSKHYSFAGRLVVATAVILACPVRAVIASLFHRNPGSLSVYSKVMWLAAKSLASDPHRPVSTVKGFAVSRPTSNFTVS